MTHNQSGIRKAAILVANLDLVAADLVLDRMQPAEAERIRRVIVELADVSPKEQQGVIDEFFRIKPATAKKHMPGIELDGRLAQELGSATRRRFADEVADSPPADVPPFRFLHEAEGEKLARILAGERPQTIALVLAHLPPVRAGGVLVRLDPELQVEVVRRLLDLEETDPEVLREVERGLQSRFSQQIRMQRRRVAGTSAVAGILAASGDGVGTQILGNIAARDRQLAERFDPGSFDFADLPRLDDSTLRTVLGASDPELMILALTGSAPELIDRVLRLLPRREADLIRHRLDHLGPTRLSDVEEARRRIAEGVRGLAVEGRVELPVALQSCTSS